MDILLDTVAFIMIACEPERLSLHAKRLFTDPDNNIFLSVVSGWEIMLKQKLGKLTLTDKPETILTIDVAKHNIRVIPLRMTDIFQLALLPKVKNHKDPFDRMLVCQSLAHKMPILTPDPWIRKYDVKTLW
ncbi:MAG: PilT-like protein [Candidatus Roizmanbacteria bacterium GW2011_GWA2_37_7]|uniref:PilT-like protein n=1 Tax=Candidatus Roizmanbacteria bacterium GW2011_GWA2_37_7 TaxID=1618481 RepID=A0A0G0JPK9_9BACT|nr:MAG: PilT-like protein [Candidatus Roizmanbacteria bacterium GW2011_GWA2_37_7]